MTSIHRIIRKIFDDYDEKNGAMQKIDYTKRAVAIVDTWQKAMNGKGLTTELICELHRLVYGDVYILDNVPKVPNLPIEINKNQGEQK